MMLRNKCELKHQELQMFGLKLDTDMSNFQPLEVVGRVSWVKIEMKY